jgi:hypothetical protein
MLSTKKMNLTIKSNADFYFEVIEDEYETFKNKYPNSEYISVTYIPIILNHHFGQDNCLLSYSTNHYICKTSINDLLTKDLCYPLCIFFEHFLKNFSNSFNS